MKPLNMPVLDVRVTPDPSLTLPPPVRMAGTYRDVLQRGLGAHGLIDPARTWRLGALGDARTIFRGTPDPTTRLSASALLLWDWSGSQSGYVDTLQAGLDSIGSALSALNIPVWAGAYTTSRPRRSRTNTNDWHEMTVVATVSEFGDRWDARRVAALQYFPMVDTPTGPALTYLRERILPTARAGKKLIVVCTDGSSQPYGWEESETVKLRARRDVRLVCLYCGDNPGMFENVKAVYPVAAWAKDRAELPSAFAIALAALRNGGGV